MLTFIVFHSASGSLLDAARVPAVAASSRHIEDNQLQAMLTSQVVENDTSESRNVMTGHQSDRQTEQERKGKKAGPLGSATLESSVARSAETVREASCLCCRTKASS